MSYCSKCGNILKEEQKFCGKCGMAVSAIPVGAEEPETQEVNAVPSKEEQPTQEIKNTKLERKKGKVVKRIVIALICLIIAGGGVFVGIKLFGSQESQLQLMYLESENETALVLNGKLLDDTIPGEVKYTKCVKSLENNIYFIHQDSSIWMVKGNKVTEIIDDAQNSDEIGTMLSSNDPYHTAYAASGKGLVYRNADGEIILYNTSKMKDDRVSKSANTFCISPDGKTVLYTVVNEGTYLYTDGEKKRLVKDEPEEEEYSAAVAVADNGEHCYVSIYRANKEIDENARTWGKATMYHYTKDGDRDKIGIVYSNIAFNIDNTQAVFAAAMDDTMYIYDAKKEKSETYTVLDVQGGATMSPVCDDALYGYGILERSRDWNAFGEDYYTYLYVVCFTDTKDLKRCFYTQMRGTSNPYGLWAISGDTLERQTEKSAVKFNTESGDTFYVEEGELYYLAEGKAKAKEIADVKGFGVSQDGKRIFYFTEDGDLYTAKADGSNKKKLDRNVSVENYRDGLSQVGGILPIVVGNDIVIYSKEDGTVYMCDVSGERQKLDIDSLYRGECVEYSMMITQPEINFMYSRNGYLFRNLSFVTYEYDGTWYNIDSNGKITELLDE